MAFRPPVSAMNGTIGPGRAARVRLIAQAVSVPPVKATPSQPGWLTRACADGLAIARAARCRRSAGAARRRGTASPPRRRSSGRLFGGLGEHGVAGGQRGGDLAGEDGQREVPGADADEDAASVQDQLVGLADRTVQRLRPRELASRPAWRSSGRSRRPRAPRRRRRSGSCRPRATQRRPAGRARPPAHRPWPAAPWRRPAPPRRSQATWAARAAANAASIWAGVGLRDLAQRRDRSLGETADAPSPVCASAAADDRDRPPALALSRRAIAAIRPSLASAIDRSTPWRVPSAGPVEVARQGDARVRSGSGRLDRADGIHHHLGDRGLFVQQGVHEGGVGAVLQQPADQIGQQVLMAAHRRIDPEREVAVRAPAAAS